MKTYEKAKTQEANADNTQVIVKHGRLIVTVAGQQVGDSLNMEDEEQVPPSLYALWEAFEEAAIAHVFETVEQWSEKA